MIQWKHDDIECMAIYHKSIGYLLMITFDDMTYSLTDLGCSFKEISRSLPK